MKRSTTVYDFEYNGQEYDIEVVFYAYQAGSLIDPPEYPELVDFTIQGLSEKEQDIFWSDDNFLEKLLDSAVENYDCYDKYDDYDKDSYYANKYREELE